MGAEAGAGRAPAWSLAERIDRLGPWLPVLVFSVFQLLIFRFLFLGANQVHFEQADNVFKGMLPYRDFLLEYPPLSLAVLLPPRLFGDDTFVYGRYLGYEMMFLDIVAVLLIALTARRLGRSPWLPLLFYTAALLALGALSAQRYDMFPAVLVLLAFYLFVRGDYTWCWVVLALGAAAKLYPIILAPVLAAYQLKKRDYDGLADGLISFAFVLAILFLPWVIIAREGFWESFQYQFSRGLQLETTYASALMVGRVFDWTPLGVEFRHGAIDAVSPLADRLAGIATPLTLLALAAMYVLYWRRGVRSGAGVQPGLADMTTMLAFWAAIILAFLSTSKVLSPQFLLWVMPLLPLCVSARRWWLWAIFVAAAALSQYIFPYAYYDLMDFKPNAVSALAARNVLLVVLTVLVLLWEARRTPEKAHASAATGRSGGAQH